MRCDAPEHRPSCAHRPPLRRPAAVPSRPRHLSATPRLTAAQHRSSIFVARPRNSAVALTSAESQLIPSPRPLSTSAAAESPPPAPHLRRPIRWVAKKKRFRRNPFFYRSGSFNYPLCRNVRLFLLATLNLSTHVVYFGFISSPAFIIFLGMLLRTEICSQTEAPSVTREGNILWKDQIRKEVVHSVCSMCYNQDLNLMST